MPRYGYISENYVSQECAVLSEGYAKIEDMYRFIRDLLKVISLENERISLSDREIVKNKCEKITLSYSIKYLEIIYCYNPYNLALQSF